MTRRIHLGLSTCPNDTFTFHALLAGQVSTPGLEFEFELLDVETLNERLLAGQFDVAKGSFHAALLSETDLGLLPSGSALGFGNGPLLLSTHADRVPGPGDTVLCPGEHTTASFLQRLYHPSAKSEQCVFSEILPKLEARRVPFGVCIHEGRFTYADHNLHLVEDLGQRWEKETKMPLPLGGILARPGLGTPTLRAVQRAIRDSLTWAQAQPTATLPTMRQYAQEFSDDVLMAHVDLYVSQWTRDLGRLGQAALTRLWEEGMASRILPEGSAPLQILGRPRLFHLCTPEDARALFDREPALSSHSHTPGEQGFVHLSESHQLRETLDVHFADAQALFLLELDGQRVGPQVDWERSRGNEEFPHLYRGIAREDVKQHWALEPDADRVLQLPSLDDAVIP